MKKSEFEKLKAKTPEEIRKDLIESQEKLRSLKFDLAAGKVKNTTDIHETKKRIARLFTFLKTEQKETNHAQ